MGGPWFTVLESGDDWQHVDSLWISDGARERTVRVEIRVRLEDNSDEN